MISLTCVSQKTNEQQNRNRATDTENKQVVSGREETGKKKEIGEGD